nr:zf-CCHC domain-containing protein/DUF4219 domain-containing protein/UBN2 domain-containing protein [Tanacetum cinerariifolium]
MTLYNTLPHKEYERVFMCKNAKEVWHTLIITHQGNPQVKDCKIDLLTQQYEKFSISSEETIDSGFTRFNAIVISLKSLDQDYSSKNHVRDFLPSKTTKEKVKSLALKAKVTRKQTSDDSDSQVGSDKDEEEETEAFNLMANNFPKLFRKESWDEMITGRKEGSSKNAYSRKGLPMIRGTLLSSSILGITKSRGRVSKDNFAYREYGTRLMLAPRSAKALQEKVLLMALRIWDSWFIWFESRGIREGVCEDRFQFYHQIGSFEKSQMISFNCKFVGSCGHDDCWTGSWSDNTVSCPYGFVIGISHGNVKFKEVYKEWK